MVKYNRGNGTPARRGGLFTVVFSTRKQLAERRLLFGESYLPLAYVILGAFRRAAPLF